MRPNEADVSSVRTTTTMLPEELSYLISGFTPSQPQDARAKAYINLTAFCQGVRSAPGKDPSAATDNIAGVFSSIIVPKLQDTVESELIVGASLLNALFQVDAESASVIFRAEGALEMLMDSVDLKPSAELAQEVAHLLGHACGIKACRTILPSTTIRWLEYQAAQTTDETIRAAAAIALIKYNRGSVNDASDTGEGPTQSFTKDTELTKMLKGLITSRSRESASDAVEGLAYLSTDPVVKEDLANDSDFLTKLFALVPLRKQKDQSPIKSSLLYGILVIICNITAYRPLLTEEQRQMQKIRQMAKPGFEGKSSETESPLDGDDAVSDRAKKLVRNGVLNVLAISATSLDSLSIRVSVGKALLSIITDKSLRGQVLQSGGNVLLNLIIKSGLPSSTTAKPSEMDPVYLDPIQALAKLAITATPLQVFGPNAGASQDAIRPFSLLVQHPASSLLQKFEALMALTNLASHTADIASRIGSVHGLLNKVELLLLEDNMMVRRAAMELICNLIAGSEEVFERYSAQSRLQVLMALADVDDMPTRQAASGALAVATSSDAACSALWALQCERHRVFPILAQLIDPTAVPDAPDSTSDPGLVHRGVVCVYNILASICKGARQLEVQKDAESSGLIKALAGVSKSTQDPGVLQPTIESIRILAATSS